ncbi:hypothetical protein MHBO_002263 [Bonamia ostreae]|uniref:Uncharacterized protein n=1 Tax=Bonamia ostreae TaxID=126728 RepID=A0ABV2ALR6_9EUKA
MKILLLFAVVLSETYKRRQDVKFVTKIDVNYVQCFSELSPKTVETEVHETLAYTSKYLSNSVDISFKTDFKVLSRKDAEKIDQKFCEDECSVESAKKFLENRKIVPKNSETALSIFAIPCQLKTTNSTVTTMTIQQNFEYAVSTGKVCENTSFVAFNIIPDAKFPVALEILRSFGLSDSTYYKMKSYLYTNDKLKDLDISAAKEFRDAVLSQAVKTNSCIIMFSKISAMMIFLSVIVVAGFLVLSIGLCFYLRAPKKKKEDEEIDEELLGSF